MIWHAGHFLLTSNVGNVGKCSLCRCEIVQSCCEHSLGLLHICKYRLKELISRCGCSRPALILCQMRLRRRDGQNLHYWRTSCHKLADLWDGNTCQLRTPVYPSNLMPSSTIIYIVLQESLGYEQLFPRDVNQQTANSKSHHCCTSWTWITHVNCNTTYCQPHANHIAPPMSSSRPHNQRKRLPGHMWQISGTPAFDNSQEAHPPLLFVGISLVNTGWGYRDRQVWECTYVKSWKWGAILGETCDILIGDGGIKIISETLNLHMFVCIIEVSLKIWKNEHEFASETRRWWAAKKKES